MKIILAPNSYKLAKLQRIRIPLSPRNPKKADETAEATTEIVFPRGRPSRSHKQVKVVQDTLCICGEVETYLQVVATDGGVIATTFVVCESKCKKLEKSNVDVAAIRRPDVVECADLPSLRIRGNIAIAKMRKWTTPLKLMQMKPECPPNQLYRGCLTALDNGDLLPSVCEQKALDREFSLRCAEGMRSKSFANFCVALCTEPPSSADCSVASIWHVQSWEAKAQALCTAWTSKEGRESEHRRLAMLSQGHLSAAAADGDAILVAQPTTHQPGELQEQAVHNFMLDMFKLRLGRSDRDREARAKHDALLKAFVNHVQTVTKALYLAPRAVCDDLKFLLDTF